MNAFIKKVSVVLMASILFACGGSGGDSTNPSPVIPTPTPPINIAPTIVVDSAFTVDEREQLSITAASSDQDGTIASVTWLQLSGPTFTVANSSNTNFSATVPEVPQAGAQAIFRITATDDDGASSSQEIQVTINNVNRPPVIELASNVSFDEGADITISAAVSDPDSDGTITTVNWMQTAGPDIEVLGASTTILAFIAPDVSAAGEIFEFKVTAEDELGETASKTVLVNINNVNQAPVSVVRNDVGVTLGNTVALDGSNAFDPDSPNLSYLWTVDRPVGSTATIASSTSVQTTFTPDIAGAYQIVLTVSDDEGLSGSEGFTVTAETVNLAPTAEAGTNRSVATGSTVALDGSNSTDPEGAALSYQWVLTPPAGSSAQLADSTSVNPTFLTDVDGTYRVSLIVGDGVLFSEPALLDVLAQTANNPPTANAGVDQTIAFGAVANLDATGSTDPDADLLSFQWSLVSAPAGSAPMLSNEQVAQPTLITDMVGTYVYRVTVNDEQTSASDNVTIEVVEASVQLCAVGAGPSPAENCLRFPWGSVNSASFSTLLSTGNITLDRLRIKAVGIDYTINITASDDSSFSRPFVDGIADGQIINANQNIDFILKTEALSVGNATPIFTISIEGQADLVVRFNYSINII